MWATVIVRLPKKTAEKILSTLRNGDKVTSTHLGEIHTRRSTKVYALGVRPIEFLIRLKTLQLGGQAVHLTYYTVPTCPLRQIKTERNADMLIVRSSV